MLEVSSSILYSWKYRRCERLLALPTEQLPYCPERRGFVSLDIIGQGGNVFKPVPLAPGAKRLDKHAKAKPVKGLSDLAVTKPR